jgi:hypothetical protein
MSSPIIATTSTFRFRRYREEVALRSSLQQRTNNNTENKNKASADATIVEHVTATNETENDDGDDDGDGDGDDGTVIQSLSNVIIVVDLSGKVLTEKKTSDTKIIELTTDQSDNNSIQTENDETDNTKQREQPICVVPEGTTLLLRNLRDCHVIM